MVMKSIFSISCFVVMTLAIGTEDWKLHPIKIIHLIEDMNATCNYLRNGTCQRVNEVVFKFKINCEEEAYQDTFCQVNRALLNCKDYNVSSFLSDFHAKPPKKITKRDGTLRISATVINTCKLPSAQIAIMYHHGDAVTVDKCTPKKSFIRLKDFCSKMLSHLDSFYRICATPKGKRLH